MLPLSKQKRSHNSQEHSNEPKQTDTFLPQEKAYKTNDSLVHHTTHRYTTITLENIGHHFNVQSLMLYRKYS